MNNSESETMETAIELAPPIPRELTTWQKVLNVFYVTTMVICSENALTIYILLHWLLACASHISYSEEETTAFISFIYFMATLVAFLSIMSHISGLLVPLFLFCNIGAFILFFLLNLTFLNNRDHLDIFSNICSGKIATGYCKAMGQHEADTMIKTALVILFYSMTCTAIMFQFARNEEFARDPRNLQQNFFQYHPHPHMLPREVPVGPNNLDEPPRYSTLEPLNTSKPAPTATSSTVTSPPRYSYWERTFGRPQVSPVGSNRSRRDSRESTAKSV